MDKKQFISLINRHKEWDEQVDKASDALSASLWDCPWVSYAQELFNGILEDSFPEDICDDIISWMYEGLHVSVDGVRIPTDTVEELWDYVKEFRKR